MRGNGKKNPARSLIAHPGQDLQAVIRVYR